MEQLGARLRAVRQRWGLTLREVEERSLRIAEDRGNPSYRISASWLNRVERQDRSLSFVKFLVLAVVYSISPEQMLSYCPETNNNQPLGYSPPFSPNTTQLLTKGPLEDRARLWLPDGILIEPIPEDSTLIASQDYLPQYYRRGIIGQRDKTLSPMIPSGSIVLINTQRRTIAHRREWSNEFDRPIYFLLTRSNYLCGWCELDKDAEWLTLVPHPMSEASAQRWRYRKEIEVIGRVMVILLRRDNG
jgi:transcriptional regulator with XRE-family HTH domain